jgi:hypothetical protein
LEFNASAYTELESVVSNSVVEVHNCIENIVISQLEEIVISFLEASAHVCNDSVGQALSVGSLSI